MQTHGTVLNTLTFLNSSFQIPAFLFVMIGVIFLTYPRPQYAPCDVWRCLLTMLSANVNIFVVETITVDVSITHRLVHNAAASKICTFITFGALVL